MAHLEEARGPGAPAPLDPGLDAGLAAASDGRPWTVAGVVAAALIVWEALSRLGLLSRLYFPPPSAVGRSVAEMTASGELAMHLGATLARVAIALLVAGTAGLLLGIAMGRSERLRGVVDPVVAAFHPIPKIAILPVVMLFLGIGESSKLFVVGLSAFFPMLISTLAGVRQIPELYFEVAANYGSRRRDLLRRVVLPASLPSVLGGLRIALNSTIHVAIAVEVVSATRGLGSLIWLSWELLRVDRLYATLVVIAVLGVGSTQAMNAMSRRLVPWKP